MDARTVGRCSSRASWLSTSSPATKQAFRAKARRADSLVPSIGALGVVRAALTVPRDLVIDSRAQIGTHQRQHFYGHGRQSRNLHVAPGPQDFSEDGLCNGDPSACRLITEHAFSLSPIAQDTRLVLIVRLVRGHELHVRRSDIPVS